MLVWPRGRGIMRGTWLLRKGSHYPLLAICFGPDSDWKRRGTESLIGTEKRQDLPSSRKALA